MSRALANLIVFVEGRCGRQLLLCAIVFWVLACAAVFAESPTIDFNRQIRPILADKCFECHGPDAETREADLRLDEPEDLVDRGILVPHDVESSELYRRISSDDEAERMPPVDAARKLSPQEIDLLRRWIESGAEYQGHWAFEPLREPDVPAAPERWAGRIKNPIDAFVLRRLEGAKLEPADEATREELLRRVSFDLVGLPPTLEELDQFLADQSPGAYERAVDRLLASPHFGERFAQDWLDLASYSDTFGYSADRERPHWYWRDWVIAALNANIPYNEFVTKQLAGDLLPGATRDEILATGFLRNHAQNAEGGIIEEEFRVEYVADRTQTFGTAFLGMTVGCARCHDHKFDPISQKEFYELFSFFNNVDEGGQVSWLVGDVSAPTVLLPTPDEESKIAALEADVRKCESALEAFRAERSGDFRAWLVGPAREQIARAEPSDMVAHFPLSDVSREMIPNAVEGGATGLMFDTVDKRISDAEPELVEGRNGPGLKLNGDDALSFEGLGRFSRGQAFTVGLWIWVPNDLADGVVFHSMESSVLYRFRGYHVAIQGKRFDVRLAHDFPYNSIHLVSRDEVPRERWVHVALAYDGASQASGVRLYVDGAQVPCDVKRDNLYKDIIFGKLDDEAPPVATRLQVGARWRDKGLSDGLVDEIVVFDRMLSPIEMAALANNAELLAKYQQISPDASPTEEAAWQAFYFAEDENYRSLFGELEAARLRLAEFVDSFAEAMVMAEMPTPRQAHILKRGAYDAPGESVSPGTLSAVLEFPEELPQNRFGLAQWLFLPENPLTARVAVNRYWQLFFGRGLVTTTEDFGIRGEPPTHPELLDWLAWQFRTIGWDLKQLARLIVTSATYRQSSEASGESLALDPQNLLLARGPSTRLAAEQIRDQALAASGLLVRKIGGPSVKPYQPEGLWTINAFSRDYVQDHGESLYRRSLYTVWKRTNPPPTMDLFDAPSRSYCVVRRERTTTPLQALALWNDPQFVEAARVLAERIVAKHPEDLAARWHDMYRTATSRNQSTRQTELLGALYDRQLEYFSADLKRAEEFLRVGEYPRDENLPAADVAASAMVASAIFNLDECLRKP